MYDIVIIGGGPAGLSAALYAGRAKKKTLVIEKDLAGGQMVTTSKIENLPGAADQPSEVAERMRAQAESFGSEFLMAQVTHLDLQADPKVIQTSQGAFEARAVILATGANPRHLGLPGEEQFIGRGLGFCASCDGAFFFGRPIYVVGGGDSAFGESLFLANLSDQVTILYRGDRPRAAKDLQDRVAQNPHIRLVLNTEVVEVWGDQALSGMVYENKKTGEKTKVEGDFGLFVYIGMAPNTSLVQGQLDLEKGYILAGEDTKTSLPLVYAAGDVRTKGIRQVVTAISDGAVAAIQATRELDRRA